MNDYEIEINEEIKIFTVNVHHFFAETMPKGKKNDHQIHQVVLDVVINEYECTFPIMCHCGA